MKILYMNKLLVIVSLYLISGCTSAQSDLDEVLKEYNEGTVPYISASQLRENLDHYLILDTRKKEEYDVSHIPGAIWVSENMNEEIFAFAKANKGTPIVVYCSVGVRSENFGEQLQEKGFSNVKNLYGSIFAWKDACYNVYDQKENPTDNVHVFSDAWSSYLKTGIKITTPLYE